MKNKKLYIIAIIAAPNPPESKGITDENVTKKTIGERSITTIPDQIRFLLLSPEILNTRTFVIPNNTRIIKKKSNSNAITSFSKFQHIILAYTVCYMRKGTVITAPSHIKQINTYF